MLSTQEISDRLEIQDLIARYSVAVDTGDWDALDGIFAADATIDYTEMGGIKGNRAEIKAYLSDALKVFSRTQHMMGLPLITLEGDRAHTVVSAHNPMVIKTEGDPLMMFCGLWYHEDLIRTDEGWRIQSLREEKCYAEFLSPKRRAKAGQGEAR
jgi:hypothetical protein